MSLIYSNSQKSTDVIKALNSFSNIEGNQIFVVGHSIFMKKLYKQIFNKLKNSQELNKKFELVKDQNVWSWVFNLNKDNNTKNIIFTRHAFSVANIYKERVSSHILGTSGKLFDKSFYNQQLEKDAKLSLYGIISTINYSDEFVKKLNVIPQNNCNIIVSCLIRTWMTALCLYLPIIANNSKNNSKYNLNNNTSNLTNQNINSNKASNTASNTNINKSNNKNNDLKINLIIGDYIKEDGSTPDNQPENIDLQIKNIRLFLKFLRDYELMPEVFNKKVHLRIIFNNNNKRNVNINTIINQKNNKNLEYYRLWHMNNKINQSSILSYKENISSMKNNKINNKNLGNNQNKTYNIEQQMYINNLKILGGIKKPTKDQLVKISRWLEPFSKKSGNMGSTLRSFTGRKNNYRSPKMLPNKKVEEYILYNSTVNGGKKTITKKSTTKKKKLVKK